MLPCCSGCGTPITGPAYHRAEAGTAICLGCVVRLTQTGILQPTRVTIDAVGSPADFQAAIDRLLQALSPPSDTPTPSRPGD